MIFPSDIIKQAIFNVIELIILNSSIYDNTYSYEKKIYKYLPKI